MTSLPRAATSPERAYLATKNQASKLYAIIDNPPVVFACRVNQAFTTHDNITQFTFDGVTTGAYTDVKPGMTVLLGTAAGLDDAGQTFAWAAPTSSIFYCGKTSSVDWANDLFVTVLLDWGIWLSQLPTYTNQHTNFKPVVRIGGNRVVELTGANVTINLDGSESTVTGGTVASHAWGSSGGTLTNPSTATPTLTLTAAGRYVFWDTVTSDDGVAAVAYRVVHVWDATHLPVAVEVSSDEWDLARGGAEISFDLWVTSSVRDRSRVILFSEDHYGGTLVSLGILPGCENIAISGWVDNPNPEINNQGGNVRFTVRGPQYWLSKMTNSTYAIGQVSATPTAFTEMQNLTVDKMLEFLFSQMTTLTNCCDVYFTGNTLTAPALEIRAGSVWEQIKQLADEKLRATVCCDPYGRLFVAIDTSLTPIASRGSIPVVISIDHDDFESVNLEQRTVSSCCQVISSGQVPSGATVYSLAPGHQERPYGDPLTLDHLMVPDQATANELAGSILEKENCPLKFTLNNLLANNPLVGVWPPQRIEITIAAEDTPTARTYSGYALVRTISRSHDAQSGAWSINWIAEAETQANLFCNGDIPNSDPNEPPIIIPPFPPLPQPPPIPPAPPPPIPALKNLLAILVTGYGVYYCDSANGLYNWLSGDAPFTAAEKAALALFVLSRDGYAFVGTSGLLGEVFSTQLGSNYRTTVGSSDYFEAITPGYTLKGLGTDYGSDQSLAVLISSEHPCSTHILSGGVLKLGNTYPNWIMTGHDITAYGGNWYASGNQGVLWATYIMRFSGDLATLENTLAVGGPNALLSVHARAADVIVTSEDGDLKIIDALGTNVAYTDGASKHADVDPTGQVILKTYQDYVGISVDQGRNWTSLIAKFSATTIRNGHVLNMGTALDWLFSFNDVNAAPGPTLNLWRTADGGTTWINALGDLYAQGVPTNGTIAVMQYA